MRVCLCACVCVVCGFVSVCVCGVSQKIFKICPSSRNSVTGHQNFMAAQTRISTRLRVGLPGHLPLQADHPGLHQLTPFRQGPGPLEMNRTLCKETCCFCFLPKVPKGSHCDMAVLDQEIVGSASASSSSSSKTSVLPIIGRPSGKSMVAWHWCNASDATQK